VGIPGHEVLADGYGFIDDLEYVHFNFGWAGISTCWYYIPDLTGAGSSYKYVDDFVYNIMPTNDISQAIVSGRVLDHNGQPLSGVKVKMKDHSDEDAAALEGPSALPCAVTNERGIWYFIVKAGEWNGKTEGDLITRTTRKLDFEVAEFGNFKSAKIENVSLDCPTRYRLYYSTSDTPAKFGNSWGNDIKLELQNPDYPEVPNTGATFEQHAVGDTRVIDEDDCGKIAKESYDGKFWWAQDGEAQVKVRGECEQGNNCASFTGVVYRAINNTYDVTNVAAKAVEDFVPEEIGSGGFVFDSLVRLQNASYGQDILLPDEEMKIGVAVQGGKLVVIAGDGANDHSTKTYETRVTIDTSVMHRLTIQALQFSFRVWFDQKRVPGTFPSRILTGDEAGEVRALGFAGRGVDADDVFTMREMPFALPGMMFILR